MTDQTWEYGENPNGMYTNEIVVRPEGEFPHGLWVADCGPNTPENVSKARLIAAAPEMKRAILSSFPALEAAKEYISKHGEPHEKEWIDSVIHAAQRAIFMATEY